MYKRNCTIEWKKPQENCVYLMEVERVVNITILEKHKEEIGHYFEKINLGVQTK